MIGIRNVAQVFLAFQIAEVELGRVRQKILISTGINDQLGQREPVAIRVRLFDFQQLAIFRRARPLHGAEIFIILDRRRVESIGAKVVLEADFHIEQIDNKRNDSNHAFVDCGGGPGSPAAF